MFLTKKIDEKEAKLNAAKKRNQRLDGKVSTLLLKLEEKDMICENATKLLSAYNGIKVIKFVHGSYGAYTYYTVIHIHWLRLHAHKHIILCMYK